MLEIDQELVQELAARAEASYPYECCGVLVGWSRGDHRTVQRLVHADNERQDSPHNRYSIDPRLLFRLEKELRGGETSILGFYHTHPDVEASPSRYDLEHAWPWYTYCIASVHRGRFGDLRAWRLREDRSAFDREPLRITYQSRVKRLERRKKIKDRREIP